jgi:hypothetical protein
VVKKGDLWYISVGVLEVICKRGVVLEPYWCPAQYTNYIFDAYLGFVPENSGNKSSDIAADPLTDKFQLIKSYKHIRTGVK